LPICQFFTWEYRIKYKHSLSQSIKYKSFFSLIKKNTGITESDVDEGEHIVDEIIINQDNPKTEAKFFYFIGRLNPPHSGHITALKELVKMANNTSCRLSR
jgi:hypothetical protein